MMDNLKDTVNEESFDLKELIYKMLGYWYLFAISVIITLAIAYFINKTTIPVYEISSTVLIQTDKSMIEDKFRSGFDISSSYILFNNIGILKSYSLTQEALKNLKFNVAYFLENRFNDIELYKECPFRFIIDSASSQPLFTDILVHFNSPQDISIEINGKNVQLYSFLTRRYVDFRKELKINHQAKVNQKFLFGSFGGTIVPEIGTDLKACVGKTYIIRLYDDLSLIGAFRSFRVTETKYSSIVTISIQGNNTKKLADFLNSLSNEFIAKGLEKKNMIADNTIRFIDSQLGEVGDSLSFSEKRLQDYRANQSIMNVDFQTQQVFSALENLQNKKAELVVNRKYFEYLKDYLEQNKDVLNLVAPSSLGIQDAVLNNLIIDLITLYNEYTELSINLKRDNPYMSSIETKIKNLRRTVQENIENLLNTSKISIHDLDQRINEISSRANQLPETERKLFGFERKFKLNDAIYTYLLTKRSEVQIAKSSYMPDNEILDVAKDYEYAVISPNKRKNNIIAILMGLFIPIVFIFLRDYFNDRIEGNKDIESVTNFPLLGHIIRNIEKSQTVVADSPLSLASESIRAIRTSFQFIAKEKQNVILVTSSMMSEGKTFTSLNLALSFALNNKKVILINFDMRKPKIHQYLGLENEIGLSNYLSKNAALDNVIVKTAYENLDVILSGTIPPNPMELISSDETPVLLSKLKEKYDYIIADTPPVGMVADALLLVPYTNVNLFIVRQNLTHKKVFAQLINTIQKKNIPNIYIILNDVQLGRKYQVYSHGYAYGYGYGYLYKQKEKKKNGNGNGKGLTGHG
jgi:capsular exopolysaccharide synthesis family protein